MLSNPFLPPPLYKPVKFDGGACVPNPAMPKLWILAGLLNTPETDATPACPAACPAVKAASAAIASTVGNKVSVSIHTADKMADTLRVRSDRRSMIIINSF
jgi:hypothetical protein